MSNKTIRSVSIAADRSGNERAVNVQKRLALLSQGLKPNASPERMDNVWLAWGFQANFMFKPVL